MTKTRTIAIVDDGSPLAAQCQEMLVQCRDCTYTTVLCSAEELAATLDHIDLAVVPEGVFQEKLSQQTSFGLDDRSFPFVFLRDGCDAEAIISATNRGALKICSLPLDNDIFLQAIRDALTILVNREEVVRLHTLMSLYEMSKRFFHAASEQAVCDGLIDVVQQVVGCTRVSILLYNENNKALQIVASKGLSSDLASTVRLKPGERIAGKVFVSGEAAILNAFDKERNPFQSLMQHQDISAAISFPLHGKDDILGVINISEIEKDSFFSEADVELLSIITSQAMLALENIRSITRREERKRMVAQLGRYVSPQVSQLLMEDNYELMNTGDISDVTVLFADIRHFTELVQELEPKVLRSFLNTYFDNFSSVIFAREGMIDKFMGDGALVVFGAPLEIVHPEDKAVSAAKEIMHKFHILREQWQRRFSVFTGIGLGIGVAKGPVFLGNIGSSQRLDYTVIGTEVNIAQRLASETAAGQILITEAVAKSLSPPIKSIPYQNMLLRGFHKEVKVYNLLQTT